MENYAVVLESSRDFRTFTKTWLWAEVMLEVLTNFLTWVSQNLSKAQYEYSLVNPAA